MLYFALRQADQLARSRGGGGGYEGLSNVNRTPTCSHEWMPAPRYPARFSRSWQEGGLSTAKALKRSQGRCPVSWPSDEVFTLRHERQNGRTHPVGPRLKVSADRERRWIRDSQTQPHLSMAGSRRRCCRAVTKPPTSPSRLSCVCARACMSSLRASECFSRQATRIDRCLLPLNTIR